MPSRDVHVDDACRRITQHITLEGLSIVTRLTEPIGPKNSRMHSTPAPADLIGGSNCQNTSALRKFLDAVPSIRIIHIQPLRDRIGHQPCGGRLAEARKLRDFIRERKLVTYIGPPGPPPAMLAIGVRDTPCAAACKVAFMGGAQRFMAPEAKLGFHRGSFPGITDEELAQEDEELVQENEARSRGLFGV